MISITERAAGDGESRGGKGLREERRRGWGFMERGTGNVWRGEGD